MTTSVGSGKVADLAAKLDVSRRTLLRKFKKHLGYSIEEYLSVIKFRKALFNFQNSDTDSKLSDIALDSNYYDQADFNHQVKYRSGMPPKELFKQLEIMDNTLFWKNE
ncbi:MAG: AraC-like DNA-binding protein [Arenicella sp.]|jgi:AraC-like DNA-binding protein